MLHATSPLTNSTGLRNCWHDILGLVNSKFSTAIACSEIAITNLLFTNLLNQLIGSSS